MNGARPAPRDAEPARDRQTLAAGLVVALLIGAELGVERFLGLRLEPKQRPGGSRAWLPASSGGLAMPEGSTPHGGSRAERPISNPEANGAPPGEYSRDREAKSGKLRARAAGREFARSFLLNPSLKALYREFADRERGPAEVSTERSETRPEFLKLAWLAPSYSAFIRAESGGPPASLAAEPPPAPPAEEGDLQAGGRRARSTRPARPYRIEARIPGGGPGGARGARSFRTGAGLSQTADVEAGPPGFRDGILAYAGPAIGEGRASPGARGAGLDLNGVNTRLPPPADPETAKMEAFCALYSHLCDGATVTPQFRPLLDNDALIGQYGLWGACFRLRIYAACRAACVGDCVAMEGWGACLDAYDQDELACIAECTELPYNQPCTIAADVFERRCVVDAPATPPWQCKGRGQVRGGGTAGGGAGDGGTAEDTAAGAPNGPASGEGTGDAGTSGGATAGGGGAGGGSGGGATAGGGNDGPSEAGKLFTLADLQDAYRGVDKKKLRDAARLLRTGGIDPEGYTLAELRRAANSANWMTTRSRRDIEAVLRRLEGAQEP